MLTLETASDICYINTDIVTIAVFYDLFIISEVFTDDTVKSTPPDQLEPRIQQCCGTSLPYRADSYVSHVCVDLLLQPVDRAGEESVQLSPCASDVPVVE